MSNDLFDSDDFPDLDDLDFDTADPATSTKRRKGPLRAILSALGFALFLLVVVALAIGGVAYVAQQNTPEPQAPPQETIVLQHVNTEQVLWADQLCIAVSSWQGERGTMSEFSEPASSDDARTAMAKNLRENAEIVSERAENLAELPLQAHERAEQDIAEVTVADNDRVLASGIDPAVYSSTQRLTSALNGYAASLRDMATDLENLASYDPYGIRLQISRISTFFGQMNDELGRELSEALSAETFDNAVTLEEVSSLETCNGSMVDSDRLTSEHGPELDTQRVAREFVITNRCEDFSEDYSALSDDPEVARNLTACTQYGATANVNPSNPVLSARIDERDAERAKPDLPPAPTKAVPTEGAGPDGNAETSSPEETSAAPSAAPEPAPETERPN